MKLKDITDKQINLSIIGATILLLGALTYDQYGPEKPKEFIELTSKACQYTEDQRWEIFDSTREGANIKHTIEYSKGVWGNEDLYHLTEVCIKGKYDQQTMGKTLSPNTAKKLMAKYGWDTLNLETKIENAE